jgi:hypothetical protein
LKRGMVCISVNFIRTAKYRIYYTRGRDDKCIKLVAKSKEFRLYSTDIGTNGKHNIKMDIT